jgi:hypothetical protein
MIIYDLCCENNHQFEGWFQSANDFESQQQRHLVCCPQCNTDVLRRIPSAVAIGMHRTEVVQTQPSSTNSGATGTAMMPAGTQVTALYRQLVQAMVSNCEDVGGSFAEEARKIHYKEVPERSIRGEASEEECNELHDEGIPILRVPGIKKEDLN